MVNGIDRTDNTFTFFPEQANEHRFDQLSLAINEYIYQATSMMNESTLSMLLYFP